MRNRTACTIRSGQTAFQSKIGTSEYNVEQPIGFGGLPRYGDFAVQVCASHGEQRQGAGVRRGDSLDHACDVVFLEAAFAVVGLRFRTDGRCEGKVVESEAVARLPGIEHVGPAENGLDRDGGPGCRTGEHHTERDRGQRHGGHEEARTAIGEPWQGEQQRRRPQKATGSIAQGEQSERQRQQEWSEGAGQVVAERQFPGHLRGPHIAQGAQVRG